MNRLETPVSSERSSPSVETAGCRACRLRSLCLWGTMEDRIVEQLGRHVRTHDLMPKGFVMCRQGDPMRSLFALRSGSAKALILDEEGVETVSDFYYPGDVVGAAALRGFRFPFAVTLLERSGFCELPIDRFKELMETNREFRETFVRRLAAEIDDSLERYRWATHASAEARVAYFILSTSAHMVRLGRRGDWLHLTMSRHDMSSFLGIAAETVSRFLTQFEAQGIIDVSGKEFRILDRQRLTEKAHVFN